MASLWYDLRFAVRQLWRAPVLSLVAVLTIALGVGANSAVFSVVNASLLRPLPYPEADRLVMVWQTAAGQEGSELPVAPADFLDWREQATSFAAMTGFHPWGHTMTGRGEPTPLSAGVIDADFFRVLGVEPVLGRGFRREEIHSAGEPLVILGHSLWQERFGGEPGVLGEKLTLDDVVYTVVGVMPAGFDFPRRAQLWRPIHLGRESARRDFQYLRVLGRLADGVELDAARAELTTISERLEQSYPETNEGRGARPVRLAEQVVGDVRPALLALFGAVGLVLAIACVNLAGLLLARAAARRDELAVRSALGAGRGRLVRQFVVESLVVSLLGGLLGLGLAVAGGRALVRLSPQPIPGTEGGLLDGRVVAFTFVTVLVAGLFFGLIPALRSASAGLAEGLRSAGRGSAAALPRLRGVLVVCEIALAAVLAICAGLLIQTFARLRAVDPGFDPGGVLAVQISLPPTTYAEQHQTQGFIDELLRRVSTLPGVEAAGTALSLPLAPGMTVDNQFSIEGRPVEPGEERTALLRPVSPGLFRALGMRLVDGRGIEVRDDAASPGVVVINETLARRFWPGRSPLGERLEVGAELGSLGGFEEAPREVVGVVADVKQGSLEGGTRPEIYLAMAQGTWRHLQLVARTGAADPLALADGIRGTVWELDDRLPVTNVRTMRSVVAGSVAQQRFSMLLLTVFAAVALALAAVGVYGLLSYAASQRSREVGVRLALGARRSDVIGLILRQGAVLTAIGLVLGLAGGLVFSRLLRSLLYGVTVNDPGTFAAVAVLLAVVALAASYLPARRAARVDPVTTLRES